MDRIRGLIFPLVVIAIGVLVLLANLGVLTPAALQRLGDLWPLLLVILGLQLILNHTMPRQQATVTGLAVTVVIVVAALAYAVWAPAGQFGTQHADSSQRVSGLSAATLDISYSTSSLEIRTGGLGDTLYQAHVDYPAGESPPTISVDQQSGSVAISQNSGFSPFRLFGSNQRHLSVTLNNKLPWTINVSGGVSNARFDLRELQVTRLDLSGGVNDVTLQLGAPKGTLGVQLSGGVNNVTLRVPSGSQWNLSASGGVSNLGINGSNFSSGNEIQKQSSGYTGATDRFDFQLSGGVSNVEFRTG